MINYNNVKVCYLINKTSIFTFYFTPVTPLYHNFDLLIVLCIYYSLLFVTVYCTLPPSPNSLTAYHAIAIVLSIVEF